MADRQECPMCGDSMRLEPVEQTSRIAGTLQNSTRHVLEWRCPDCDYFEEVDGQIEGLPQELESWLKKK
ncbi:hypothetical protein [Luteitalea sp.]